MTEPTLPIRLRVETLAAVLHRLPENPEAWLSASERGRHVNLRAATRAGQYLAGHWMAREELAAMHGGQPEDWPLRERRSQAPVPEHEDCGSRVSISHSGDWIAVAVANRPIGIDIEQRRPRAALAGFAHLLRADGDPPELDADVLLQRWVLKEAWIKRHGLSALPAQLARIRLRACPNGQGELRLWAAADVHLALCCEQPDQAPPVGMDVPSEAWAASETAGPQA